MTCALIAAFLMIITGCLKMRDAYRAMQRDVLLLIAGTIALGLAMERSGASTLYAEAYLGLFSLTPWLPDQPDGLCARRLPLPRLLPLGHPA